jgi:hypothetical protein
MRSLENNSNSLFYIDICKCYHSLFDSLEMMTLRYDDEEEVIIYIH